jgi:hypothetical protein
MVETHKINSSMALLICFEPIIHCKFEKYHLTVTKDLKNMHNFNSSEIGLMNFEKI